MQEQMILQREIKQGDFTRGGEASSALKDILRKLGIKTDVSRRLTIITYELEMNIIIHTLGGEITVFISSEQVKVIAKDQGPGIVDVEKIFQPGYSTANDYVRDMGFGAGMGLNNIKFYSDQVMVETGQGDKSEFIATVYL